MTVIPSQHLRGAAHSIPPHGHLGVSENEEPYLEDQLSALFTIKVVLVPVSGLLSTFESNLHFRCRACTGKKSL